MTPVQIDLARHALGLDGRRKTSYRNHFVTGPGSSNYAPWIAMVEAGDAKRWPPSQITGGDDCFTLTLQGARAALRRGERLDPEDFPTIAADSEEGD